MFRDSDCGVMAGNGREFLCRGSSESATEATCAGGSCVYSPFLSPVEGLRLSGGLR